MYMSPKDGGVLDLAFVGKNQKYTSNMCNIDQREALSRYLALPLKTSQSEKLI